ncbi:hypothetical protein L1887_49093 [Cichorium endivia]|nr:hypothetical protein L1887_49093 [Cichorium endivia]
MRTLYLYEDRAPRAVDPSSIPRQKQHGMTAPWECLHPISDIPDLRLDIPTSLWAKFRELNRGLHEEIEPSLAIPLGSSARKPFPDNVASPTAALQSAAAAWRRALLPA